MGVNVLVVACSFCGAPAGERCTKPGWPGKCRDQLTSIAAHPKRIGAAAVASGHSQDEADELVAAAAIGQARRLRAEWATHPTTTPTL